jgi:hypothetical protein
VYLPHLIKMAILPRPRSSCAPVRAWARDPLPHFQPGLGARRHALVEACWTAVFQPGPLHAFYDRIRARSGHSVAVVSAARKLACLFWGLLRREQDYAYQQPSLTRKKLRRLELTAGHRRYTPETGGIWHANEAVRQAERELARQAELAYARSVRDWHAAQTKGAGATPGRASQGRRSGKQRGRASVANPAL